MKIYDETLQQYVEVSIKALDSMPIGSIIAFAGSSIPAGWLICDGEKYAAGVNGVGTEYPDLFSVIGYTYGSYKGEDFYRVPDLKGRVPVGQDTNQTEFDTLGETGGEKTHTLNVNEMPTHYHSMPRNPLSFNGVDGAVKGLGNGDLWAQGIDTFTNSNNTGGDQPHNNLQPYQVVNYIIKAENTTPTMASVLNTSSNSTTDTYSCDFINNMQVQAEPEIAVQSTTPTGEECLWINPEEYPDGNLNPITNTYSIAEDKGYSCDYSNEHYGGVELWTNPHPDYEFGSQTISIDLTDYKYIEIYYNRWQGTTLLHHKIYFEKNSTIYSQLTYSDYDSGEVRSWNRVLTINNSGIGFNVNQINGATSNYGLVPYKIIGYK